jgi:sodium/potassium-transporting ATPase subunit alpha
VKNLEGVETLGSTSCICSDKTGTLTQNVMTVAQLVYGEENGCVTHDAPSSFTGGRKTYDTSNASFQRILRCAVLNNVSTFNESSKWVCDDEGQKILDAEGNATPIPFQGITVQGDGSELKVVNWVPVGNASEAAFIKLAQSEANDTTKEGDVEEIRKANPSIFVIPFNSKNKYQIHVHEIDDGPRTVLMKGAPERVLDRCTHVLLNGHIQAMTDEERQSIVDQQVRVIETTMAIFAPCPTHP